MKANELRIGNIVGVTNNGQQLETSITLIDGVGQSVLTEIADQLPFLIDDLKPIPLTEEWLLRFGFGKKEKNDVFENIKMKYWAKNAVLLFFNEPNNDGSFLSGFGSYLRKSSYFAQTFKWIKYVHQLQNLFFALTDQELILKPKKETA